MELYGHHRKILALESNHVFLIDPKDQLFDWIEKLLALLAGEETPFIVDDMVSDKNLDKRRRSLLDLAISGRHRKQSIWLLTQSYTALPKNLRRQKSLSLLKSKYTHSEAVLLTEPGPYRFLTR